MDAGRGVEAAQNGLGGCRDGLTAQQAITDLGQEPFDDGLGESGGIGDSAGAVLAAGLQAQI